MVDLDGRRFASHWTHGWANQASLLQKSQPLRLFRASLVASHDFPTTGWTVRFDTAAMSVRRCANVFRVANAASAIAGERMNLFFSDRQAVGQACRTIKSSQAALVCAALVCMATLAIGGLEMRAEAQAIDCGRLQQQIARGDRGGNRIAQAARRQAAELARTQAYAHQLGCDGFILFGGNPQCGGLNARIAQMQSNLSALQASGGGRNDLVARYNAYCRGGQPAPQQRGFFESLFGGFQQQQAPPPLSPPPPPSPAPDGDIGEDGAFHARGGSQAVCVRTCDGGFFPLAISARHSNEDLTEMCQALCPGTETAVYTRNPDAEIKTSLGIDGKPYMEMPNALHFQKTFSAACSCRPLGKSWAETLANAEEVLDSTRKGDIMVTPEKSAELSRMKINPKALAKDSDSHSTDAIAPKARTNMSDAGKGDPVDASKRTVRQVGPQP